MQHVPVDLSASWAGSGGLGVLMLRRAQQLCVKPGDLLLLGALGHVAVHQVH